MLQIYKYLNIKVIRGLYLNAKVNQGRAEGHPEPVELTPDEVLAWTGLLHASSTLTRRLDLELRREHGLSVSEWEVLFLLGRVAGGRARMSEIAGETLLSQGAITHLVRRLEKQGLARKEPDAQDRRVHRVALTEDGRARLEAATRTHFAGVREHFSGRFSERELSLLAGFWERLLPGHAETAFGPSGDPRGTEGQP